LFHVLAHFLVAMISIVAFWSPNIIGHAIMGTGSGPPGTFFLVGVLPALVVVVAHQMLIRSFRYRIHGGFMALNMLLAIWISGPSCMMLSSTFSGSGFANPDSLQTLVFMTAIFPITTFSMSAYTMALGALLLASAYLAVYIPTGFATRVKKPNAGNPPT